MRLPSIIVVMTLVLVSGVVSIRVMESRMGGATVPGLIVVDAPGLTREHLVQIQARHAGSSVEALEITSDPLGPFDVELLTRLRDRGDLVALYTLLDGEGGVLRPTLWHKRRSVFPDPPVETAVDEVAAYVAAQHGTRAFFVGLTLPYEAPTDGIGPVRTLAAATAELPSFRRCSLVLVGAQRRNVDGQRWVLRVDLGRWVRDPEPALADLLSARW
jgi:hypothetical protein